MSDEPRQDEGPFSKVDPSWLVNGFFVVMIAWFLYLFVQATAWTRFETWVFPLAATTLGAFLAVTYLLRFNFPSRFPRLAPETGSVLDELDVDEPESLSPPEQRKVGAIMTAWAVALPFMMYVFGFSWALPPYVWAFVWYFRRDARLAVIVTVIFSLLVYLLFVQFLNILWWDGILGLPEPIRYLS